MKNKRTLASTKEGQILQDMWDAMQIVEQRLIEANGNTIMIEPELAYKLYPDHPASIKHRENERQQG